MANAWDENQGHSKPATDTKERGLIGRGGAASRYPIGVRITVVNGGGASYDCVEVDSDGTDISPTITHTTVKNIGDVTLAVNDKIPIFFCADDNSFFFGEAS